MIKTTLTLNKPANVGICILESSELPIYEFHYDYTKRKYHKNSGTNSFMYEIETQKFHDDFSKNKKMLNFSNCSASWKYFNNTNTLVVEEMKDEMLSVVIEKFHGVNLKIYSILVSSFREYKKAKVFNKNVVTKRSHKEYKNVLLNKTF